MKAVHAIRDAHPNLQAIGWMLVTSFTATTISTVAKYLESDFHPFQMVFFYNLTGLICMIPWLLERGVEKPASRKAAALFLLRSVLEVGGFSLIFTALALLPLPVVISLQFSMPIFATLAAMIILRERPTAHTWLALGLGVIGVFIITRPGTEAFNPASLLVLGAMVCFSCCGIIIKIQSRRHRPVSIVFYMLLLTGLLSLPLAGLHWESPRLEHFPWLALFGALVALVQFSVTKALSKADITLIFPFAFTGLIWASLYGYLFFGEVVEVWTLLGGAVIVAGATYAAVHTHRISKLRETNPYG